MALVPNEGLLHHHYNFSNFSDWFICLYLTSCSLGVAFSVEPDTKYFRDIQSAVD